MRRRARQPRLVRRLASLRGATVGGMRIKGGDTLVVLHQRPLSFEQAEHLRHYVARHTGCSRVLVLGDGLDIGVLRGGGRP